MRDVFTDAGTDLDATMLHIHKSVYKKKTEGRERRRRLEEEEEQGKGDGRYKRQGPTAASRQQWHEDQEVVMGCARVLFSSLLFSLFLY